MSDILKAIDCLIRVFSKYASKDGNPHCLSKPELRDLLNNELRGFLKGEEDQKKLDSLFHDLDANKDDNVSFQEFGTLILTLATVCHEYFVKK